MTIKLTGDKKNKPLLGLRMNLPDTFGERLSAIRQEAGYSTARQFYDYMEKCWQRMGVVAPITYATYAAYENNTRQPKLEVVAQLARFLNTSLDILLNLYDEEYLVQYLYTRGYDVRSIGEHIVLNIDGNFVGIKKNILLGILKQGHSLWTDFLKEYLDKALSNSFRAFSESNIAAGNNLIGAAIAELLKVDFKAFKRDMEFAPEELKNKFKNNIVMALLFYYFTHVNPFENIQVTLHFFDSLPKFYNLDNKYSRVEVSLKNKYEQEALDMFDYSNKMERIEFIEHYLREILGVKGGGPKLLKKWFFCGINAEFYLSEYEYNENDLQSSVGFYLSGLHTPDKTSKAFHKRFQEVPRTSTVRIPIPLGGEIELDGVTPQQMHVIMAARQKMRMMHEGEDSYEFEQLLPGVVHRDTLYNIKPKKITRVYATEKDEE